VIEAIAEGVYEWSADTRQLKVSDRLNKMLGFEKGELTSGRWLERIHPDDRHRLRNETIHYFKGEVPYFACEYRVLNKASQWRWVSDRATAIRDEGASLGACLPPRAGTGVRAPVRLPALRHPFMGVARSQKAKPGRTKRAAGTKKHALFDK
jgi:PAS domain S-box-containing protein